MTDRDRPTPKDPLPAAVPRPGRSEQAQRADAQRLIREAGSAARQAARAKAPPVPFDTTPIRDAAASLPPPSSDPRDAVVAALRAENEALRSGRKRTPAGGVLASPVPTVEVEKGEAITDAAIGRGVRSLLRRFWPLLLGAVGLGAGGAGALKPAADPTKADATMARVGELERRVDRSDKRAAAAEDWARETARVNICLRRQQARVNEALTPAKDHMGAGRRLEPFDDVCPDDAKPP